MAHLVVVAIPTPQEFIFHNVVFGISFPPLSPADATSRLRLYGVCDGGSAARLSNTVRERKRRERGGERERVASPHVVEMTQINIHYLNQTKINGSLSLQLSPTVSCRVLVGQNQH